VVVEDTVVTAPVTVAARLATYPATVRVGRRGATAEVAGQEAVVVAASATIVAMRVTFLVTVRHRAKKTVAVGAAAVVTEGVTSVVNTVTSHVSARSRSSRPLQRCNQGK